MRDPFRSLLHGSAKNFWALVASNCADHCVLEWCKLFGEEKGEFGWKQIVTDTNEFMSGLLALLGITEAEFDTHVKEHRRQRDKVIAHLDLERTMYVPHLDLSLQAVWPGL